MRLNVRRLILGAAALVALPVASCGWTQSPRDEVLQQLGFGASGPRNVLLVSLDTTRADRFGAYGGSVATPHFDELASRGYLFESASTVTALTLPAHTSLFTSLWPETHGIDDNALVFPADGPVTAAELLRASGRLPAAFVGTFVLDARWGLNRGFEVYDAPQEEPPHPLTLERPASEVVDPALDWLRSRSEPFFLWVHMYDAHLPYQPPEPYRDLYPDAPYDGEVAYADAQMGRLLQALRDSGEAEQTLVIVLADHGEGLGDHGEVMHGILLYESTIQVPLVIARADGPGAANRIAEPVSIVDLLPTLLELLDEDSPETFQGRSLLPAMSAAPTAAPVPVYAASRYAYKHYRWSPLRSLREGRWKLIEAPRIELYDLATDPGELSNLAEAEPKKLETLREQLHDFVATLPGPETEPGAPDAEALEKLAALGYLSGTAQAGPADADVVLPDPKDRIKFQAELVGLRKRVDEGAADEVIQRLEELLGEDPELSEARWELAEIHSRFGRHAVAASHFRRILERHPTHGPMHVKLAQSLERAGDAEGALLAYGKALELDRRHLPSVLGVAQLLNKLGRVEEAAAALQDYLKDQPRRPVVLALLADYLARLGQTERAWELVRESMRLEQAGNSNPAQPDPG